MIAFRRLAAAAAATVVIGCTAPTPGADLRGTSWSRHEGMTGAPHVVGVGNGVAVGFGGSEGGLEAFRSTDGISWAAVAAIDPLNKAGVADIAAGEAGRRFAAVGSWADGEYGRAAAWVSDGSGGWTRATDGQDFATSSGSGGTLMSAVTWGQSRWVAGGMEWGEGVGEDGVIWTSPDGVSWSRVTLPDPGREITDVIAGGPGFVAVGSAESTAADGMTRGWSGVWTSVDGTIWARVPDSPAFADAVIQRVVTGGPGLVGIGYAVDATGVFVPVTWSSRDGLSWTKEPAPADPNPWTIVEGPLQGRIMTGVAATPNGFVAVGLEFGLNSRNLHRAAVWTSADGRSWARVPNDAVFDGGQDSSARFGMRTVYLIGNRLIASGSTPAGPTLWISPPEPGKLPGQGSFVPAPESQGPPPEPSQQGATPAETPAPAMPPEVAAAEFVSGLCGTMGQLDLAVGTDPGAGGPAGDPFFAALDAHDAEAILAAIGPTRDLLTGASEQVVNWIPWDPGAETQRLLDPFLRHLLGNLGDIKRDAQAGNAPAAGTAAFLDEEGMRQLARIREAARAAIEEAVRQAPGVAAC